ncbi:MAG TPA: HAD family hydrolase, partial [Anaerolineales bacterium]
MILSLQPRIRGAILDLDGTLWRSDTPIGDLPSIFKRFAELEIRPILATNNATLDISQYLTKLEGFGVCLDPYQVINSGQAAAYLLRSRFPQGGKVYIVGEDGLHRALAEAGFVHSEDSDALAVVAGMDRRITFEKLTRATEAIRAGAIFIGTNPDTTFPMPGGKLIPGAGSILAAIAAASGVEPTIAGKPERA